MKEVTHYESIMKAYVISDLKGYADYLTVVFAETSGKAKAIAITTDAFNDYDFTEISARRVPKLDKYYRGLDEMDWFDDADRVALVRDAGYSCNPECLEEEDCTRCPAKQWCERWQNEKNITAVGLDCKRY